MKAHITDLGLDETVTCSTTGEKLPYPTSHSFVNRLKKHATAFSDCKPLPGVGKASLEPQPCTERVHWEQIKLALASSTKSHRYEMKTSRSKTKRLLSFFEPDMTVLGDDPRVRQSRGKPAPDIYLVALQSLNS
ncbi:hypothetical protein PABG_12138 [Paracoccidioides brasiliensis Pb03]|nr:hypothetical protein PABG_12138 [Paracoccidioides brasiliensis Pb03]